MKIVDISWPITSSTTGYKDKGVVEVEWLKNFEKDGVRESAIRLKNHTGTHIDAPSHFMQDGVSIDRVDLNSCVGDAVVLDLTQVQDAITRADLMVHAELLQPGIIVLLKTRNSARGAFDPFDYQFVYVAADAADYLVERGVKAVGVDYLGIERNQPDHATHVAFMTHGVTIIEGLRLQHVAPGVYLCVALPLALVGLDAAPARAVLMSR